MKIILDMTVADDVNRQRLAEDFFDWLCTGGESEGPPDIESFDSWELVRE